MMELVNFVVTHGPTIVGALLTIVGGFAVLATVTPTKADDKLVNAALKVLHFLAGNFGEAKNAEK